MPARFEAEYVGADGKRHTPVMIHRACYGSLERFLGIIIENYAGAFPLWLAPEQVQVIPVSEKFNAYAVSIKEQLLDAGVRASVNLGDDRVGYKIRGQSLKKIPFAIIVGEKEVEAGSINVRQRESGEQTEMLLSDFLAAHDFGPPKRQLAKAAE
jgi:threonyl-tRNA synthetase